MHNRRFQELDAIGEDKLWEEFIKNSSDRDIRDYFIMKYVYLTGSSL